MSEQTKRKEKEIKRYNKTEIENRVKDNGC